MDSKARIWFMRLSLVASAVLIAVAFFALNYLADYLALPHPFANFLKVIAGIVAVLLIAKLRGKYIRGLLEPEEKSKE